MPETLINPYNFVPLGTGPDRTRPYPGLARLRTNSYSGRLECRLLALSPLVSCDHGKVSRHELKNPDGTRVIVPSGRRIGQPYDSIKVFSFLRRSDDQPIIQGASLKGMIRSIYEAMTDGCLPLASPTGLSRSRGGPISYTYAGLGAHRGDACDSCAHICQACQMFGTIEGDAVHCQGRIRFGDGVMIVGRLVEERHFLRELSSPKPHHSATYGKGGQPGGVIAGRKFYYHHVGLPHFDVPEKESNDRSNAIDEYAPPGVQFSFQVFLDNVEPDELGRLLLALELDQGMAHKIGMGKALGLGSCQIVVDPHRSRLTTPAQRYGTFGDVTLEPAWYAHKAKWQTLASELVEILRLNKPEEGAIQYPQGAYPSARIDALGVFGGTAKSGGQPRRPKAQAAAPAGNAPSVKKDEQAAWLREMFDDELILMTPNGETVRRPRKAYQGKPSLLEVGRWYILAGTKSVKPAP